MRAFIALPGSFGILAALVLAVAVPCANADTGKSSFAFLRIAAGSRPAALAEAVTASGLDITSSFYNPALLRSFKGNTQAAFMYDSYFSDVSQNYLGLGTKTGKVAIGGYLALGSVTDFERRTHPDTVAEGTFDENNFIGALTLAYHLRMLDVGLSLKYAYEKIDYSSASAAMFDMGIYLPAGKQISFGAAAKNIGTKPKFESVSYPVSKEYRIGLAFRPSFMQQMAEFVADGVFFSDLDPKLNLGMEYTYKSYFALRTGYGLGYDSRDISIGGGVFYRQLSFDYAFVGYRNDLGGAHRFTVAATF